MKHTMMPTQKIIGCNKNIFPLRGLSLQVDTMEAVVLTCYVSVTLLFILSSAENSLTFFSVCCRVRSMSHARAMRALHVQRKMGNCQLSR